MAIDVDRRLDSLVAEPGLDNVDRHPRGEEQARVGMPEVVEPHVYAAGLCAFPVALREPVWAERRTTGPLAHLGVCSSLVAPQEGLSRLPLGDDPAGPARLRLVGVDRIALEGHHRPGHGSLNVSADS